MRRVALCLFLSSVAGLALGCNKPASEFPPASAQDGHSNYGPVDITDKAAAETIWNGRRWRVNAGVILDDRLSYSVQTDPPQQQIRFELRDSVLDRSPKDSRVTRRAELSGSLLGNDERLPNGVPLWGAFTFVHHAWEEPEGMRALTGGVYGQIHMGSQFGGSPALAFRRSRDGLFRVTTRGQYDAAGTIQYEGAVSFDEVHDLVYRAVLHPSDGSLSVWLDGDLIVHEERISLGHESAQSYWNLGLYFSGGVAGNVSAEFTRHIYPAPQPLQTRIGTITNSPE